MSVNRQLLCAAAVAAITLTGCDKTPEPPATETMKIDGGAVAGTTDASHNIIENLMAMPNEKTLVSAVTAAGLAEMLSGDGPYTVFAPSDAAFQQVPVVTRNGWMRPAQKDVLAGVLKYHVVPGKLAAADLAAKIEQGAGKAVLTTVDGQELTASMNGDKILLTAASGNKATVTASDLDQSNGVVHVVDAVLLPKT
ncbi:fasciclin domain-containing protein [Sphingopyxis indica]|uniref:fasciclin domain-containing protein n=1 Tax=Sphingopyxis indica TaxID=436663 RepID=UPI002939446E|nr:fasciclin domain-containing protein [Sphingopyxis indica]WOF41635.1 fasciclin domain-containing protein [Sphingopyxis indica]